MLLIFLWIITYLFIYSFQAFTFHNTAIHKYTFTQSLTLIRIHFTEFIFGLLVLTKWNSMSLTHSYKPCRSSELAKPTPPTPSSSINNEGAREDMLNWTWCFIHVDKIRLKLRCKKKKKKTCHVAPMVLIMVWIRSCTCTKIPVNCSAVGNCAHYGGSIETWLLMGATTKESDA